MSTGYYYSSGPIRKTKTLSITSGKGGVGKSTLISNMALYFSKKGKRVLILDGDLGMSNVDIMFNSKAQFNLFNLLRGERDINEIIHPLAPNIDVISGGSGVYELQNLSVYEKKAIMDQLSELSGLYDYLLIDTAPGIADNVLYMNAAADEILVVLTPDPASLTDSYALIKVLNLKYKISRFSVVCNFVKDEREALKSFKRVSDVANEYLNVGLDYKGFVPMDLSLRQATKAQQLILQTVPRCASSFAIRQIAESYSGLSQTRESKGGINIFWQQLVGVA